MHCFALLNLKERHGRLTTAFAVDGMKWCIDD